MVVLDKNIESYMTDEVKKELEKIKNENNWQGLYYGANNIVWSIVCQKYSLSESFIREFKDYVWWGSICAYQKLSESFIREFKDKVYWNVISNSQQLSSLFIHKFRDKLNIGRLIDRGMVTQEYLDQMNKPVKPDYIKRYEHMDLT